MNFKLTATLFHVAPIIGENIYRLFQKYYMRYYTKNKIYWSLLEIITSHLYSSDCDSFTKGNVYIHTKSVAILVFYFTII